ncbi:hypothetical protein A5779_13520 [Mycolicibacterium peregrinum]|uniref:Uncharacterized protein n=1 Tax=Mycolicibacterium peregrinum TaxID=43304 RepID=A0A1A0WHT0_MYCPR|nr:hypothetical protein A5779_13520 [Mycolicibacterium peregrinum]
MFDYASTTGQKICRFTLIIIIDAVNLLFRPIAFRYESPDQQQLTPLGGSIHEIRRGSIFRNR